MLNEHDRDPSSDEGEYHFSDEGGYETHGADEDAKAPTVTEKAGLGASFASYRRFVIMGGVFAGVLLVVYLVMTPSNTVPSTDITAASSSEVVPSTPGPSVADIKAKLLEDKEKAKVAAQELVENSKASTVVVAEATPTVQPPAAEFSPPPMNTSVPSAPPPAVQAAEAPTNAAPVSANAVDRLTALEESNNRLISQLNADYARRLAEFETQDKVMQEQIKSLNSKITGMEAAMTHMMQNVSHPAPAASSPPSPPPTLNIDNSNGPGESGNAVLTLPQSSAIGPKSNYSVQAIIPGRAWLRNEAGDTLTVAEGDLLRGLGRVTKIDPYDGTIQIDTGTRVMTLTYGNGDYA